MGSTDGRLQTSDHVVFLGRTVMLEKIDSYLSPVFDYIFGYGLSNKLAFFAP